MTRRPSPIYSAVDDETPIQTRRCSECGKRPVPLIKVIGEGVEGKKVTAWVCGNKECKRFTDTHLLGSWKRL